VEVGSGRAAPDHLSALLGRPDRALAGPTAPAAGLCLAGVLYDEARLRLDDKSL
jgi:tRNA pseudouridine38-40 synthase